MSLKCQNCGAENVDHAKYCCECGIEMRFYCRKCGSYNPNGKFCIFCGTKNDPVNWNEASTNPKDYSWENVYEDESGTYTADRLVFLKGNYDTKKIEIRQGTRIICKGALRSFPLDEYTDITAIVEELIIPNSVTKIGDYAFYHCSSLQSIVIPDSVTQIGDAAFCFCESLKSIVIPNSVTQIGEFAFSNCRSLQPIIIPDSVTQIGKGAFYGCSSLQSIVIPNSVTRIGFSAFEACSNILSIVVSADNTIFDSRNNCNAIIETKSNTLVAGCSQTVIPDSITEIGYCAFKGRSSLQSIVIPDSVTKIGEGAFSGCSSLQSILIPNSVTRIGFSAFEACSNILSIVVSADNTIFDSRNNCNAIIETESNTLVAGCSQTVIPNSVTQIGNFAFNGRNSLQSIVIPNTVTRIGDCAFLRCSSLKSIVIPDSVTEIGLDAFRNCSSLQSIVVSEGNPIYDSRNNCNAIIETKSNILVTGCNQTVIPDSVTQIGGHAFSECISLHSIVIPNTVTKIGTWAFVRCSSMKSIVIPDSVTFIGGKAFDECKNLHAIIIPKGTKNKFQELLPEYQHLLKEE